MSVALEPLAPFGLLVRCDGEDIDSFDAEQLHGWVAEHGVVVVRGATVRSRCVASVCFQRHCHDMHRPPGPSLISSHVCLAAASCDAVPFAAT